jgi:hypothetical protein
MIIPILAAMVPANAFAKPGEFLAPAEAVKVIMDGRPWSAVSGEGRRATLTLNRDGTGTFEGPITLSISWEVKGQNVCLYLKVDTLCVRFRPVAGGYAAYEGEKLDLTLSRSGPRS